VGRLSGNAARGVLPLNFRKGRQGAGQATDQEENELTKDFYFFIFCIERTYRND
jgi:hypothetical protein